MNINEVIANFNFEGDFVGYEPFGGGHINDTYALTFLQNGKPHRYVLQRVNNKIFKDIAGLMGNIIGVTKHVGTAIAKEGGLVERETLRFLQAKNGEYYHIDEDGHYFRSYHLVENAHAFQKSESAEMFADAGRAFGAFVRRLNDFDATKLVEVIPKFHDTANRLKNFKQALVDGRAERIVHAQDEIDFVLKRQDYAHRVVDLLAKGEIPCRVTHNDTKLNNVLFDEKTHRAICVIDLDTIMPGSLLYDFGDAIRSGCNTGLEDDKDLSLVNFDKALYDAFEGGFLASLGEAVTEKEREMLPFSAILMTYECGMRFLSDYLVGDTYFKTKYDDHNLVRARTQFKLVADMERVFGINA